jgi:hypothetical protein
MQAVTAITAVSALSTSAYSWGRLGHRVAAKLAEQRLAPGALAAVHDLLGAGVSIEDISTPAE